MIWYSLPEGIVVYIVSAHHLHPRGDQTHGCNFAFFLVFVCREVTWLAEDGVRITLLGQSAEDLVKFQRLCQKIASDQNQKVQQTSRRSFILPSTVFFFFCHSYRLPAGGWALDVHVSSLGPCCTLPILKEKNKSNILDVMRSFFFTISIQMNTSRNIPSLLLVRLKPIKL